MTRQCDICEGHVVESWTLRISDDKEYIEYSGHTSCINELEMKVKQLKNLDKLKVKDLIKKLKLKES